MNLTRQPLLLAFATLLALVVATILRKQGLSFPPEAVEGARPMAAGWLLSLQTAFPRLAWSLCGVLAIVSSLSLGRLGPRYTLYSGGTLLTIPLYGVVACGLFLSDDYLTGFLASFLLVRAVCDFCASYRTGYTFDALFRGALYLGILPLLYAPALLLVPFLPIVTLLFKRTFREWIVAIAGLLLPAAALCYVHGLITGNFTAPAEELWLCLQGPGRFPIFSGASFVLILQLLSLSAAVLGALFYFLSDIYAANTRARAILTSQVWLLLLCVGMGTLPSMTASLFPLLAIPASLLLPLLFVRLRSSFANALYLALLALCALRLFF